MGILLTFMFLWNMIGALVLIPALSHFLLRNVGLHAPAHAASEGGAAVPKVQAQPARFEAVAGS
jgi:uncharacterized protein